ncbi:MAG: TerB family tellurite resistance protein [Reichenbachiella sp.]
MSDKTLPSELEKLLLKTVFAFMICDSHISYDEVQLIKKIAHERKLFGNIDIDQELKDLVEHVNRRGISFFDDYFKKLKHTNLSEQDELKILDIAIKTIHADFEIKQEEISFLKILRVLLKVSNPKILETFPTVGDKFVDPDHFTDIYFKELYANFFQENEMPLFDITDVVDITDEM